MDWLQIAHNSQENFIFPKVMFGIVFVFSFFFIKDYVIKAFTLNKKLSTLISKFKNKEIDKNKLSRLLTGVQDESGTDMEKIAQALGKDVEFFLKDSIFRSNYILEKYFHFVHIRFVLISF